AGGLEQLCQAVARYRAWATVMVPYLLAVVAEAQGTSGHAAEGVVMLDEALAVADQTGEQWYDAELWRLKGELTRQQSRVQKNAKGKVRGARANVNVAQSTWAMRRRRQGGVF